MVQFSYDDALKYREIINKAAESLTDEDALAAPLIFEAWAPGIAYEIDKRVQYGGSLYKVLQNHTSHEAYPPDITISLYALMLIPDPEVIPEWVQPISTNAYSIGDKVRHNGHVWISLYDNNVWEPGVYGWEEVDGT